MKFFSRRHLLSPLLLLFICHTFLSNAKSHHIRHYRDRFKRQQGAHLYLPGSYVTDGEDDNNIDSGPWSDWSTPSQCSRTCGGGVSTQYRQCQDGYNCTGPSKRHFSCNTQDCPDLGDFRAQQCSEYDGIPFDGVMYTWVPYIKAPNPCELNCMPKGERFYYRHKERVTDGTRCNDEKLDVCVDGKCQPVGCDMMLGSEAREDKCRKCGGDGSTCKTVSGTLDMKDLQVGYNDVLLIPAGATNIHVKEKGPSNNYLAVRNTTGHYYLNGNWRIDFPATNEFAGCKFHYERYPQGLPAPDILYCLGPIDEALFIVLLFQDVNVGIDYEYSVPKNIQAGSELETYAWIFDEYTQCSASCGGGVQYRNVTCAGRKTLQSGSTDLCDQSNEPASSQICNDFPCPPQWVTKPWQKCSAPCGSNGKQIREVVCEQVIRNGVASIIDNAHCSNMSKPVDEQQCNEGRECGTWHIGPWNPCDHLCGEGTQTRQVVCYRKAKDKIEVLEDDDCSGEERPESEKTCNLRPCEGLDWVTSEWSGCDKCGLTNETRRVQCATSKGKVYPDELCDSKKPEETRECKSNGDKKCDYEWFASQWSDCSAKCGKGVQTRKVFCTKISEAGDIKKVEDNNCDASKKYESINNCTAEKEKCEGEWFTGPWKECSKKCGGGVKERKVICLRDDVAVAPTECGPDTLPDSSEVCNQQPCSKDEILPLDITQPVDESEPTTEKSDITDGEESTLSSVLFTETTVKPKEDEDIEYEIVESDTCDDGEWVEAEDETESTDADDITEAYTVEKDDTTEPNNAGKDDGSKSLRIAKSEVRIESEYELMVGDDPGAGILTTSEGSGDTDSTYSTDSTMTTIEGSGDSEFSTPLVNTAETDESFIPESHVGVPTLPITEKSTDTSKSTTDFTGSTESTETPDSTPTEITETTTEFTGSTESTESTVEFTGTTEEKITGPTESTASPETTVEFTGTTEKEITQTTTEFTGSTESTETTKKLTEVTETTVEFTGSTETTEEPESTTEFTGTTEEKITETTTEFTGSTESIEAPETTTAFTGSTESTEAPETTTAFTGSTESTEAPETTPAFTGSTESTEAPETTTAFTGSTESTEAPETTPAFTGSTEAAETTPAFTGSTESTEGPVTTPAFTGSTETTEAPETTPAFTGTTESTEAPETTPAFTGSTESTEAPETTPAFTGSTESTEAAETTTAFTGSTEAAETTPAFTGSTEAAETTPAFTGSTEAAETTPAFTGSTEAAETTTAFTGSTEAAETTTAFTGSTEAAETTPAFTGSTEATEAAESTTEFTGSTETKITEATTEFTGSTESTAIPESTTEYTGSTETEITETTTEFTGSTEPTETTTEFTGSTETTESTTEFTGSTESSSEYDIWFTTETSTIMEIFTPKPRLCKRRKRKDCKKTSYGCCPDKVTPAKGPFDKGCAMPKTCKESEFGCCADGVSQALDKNFYGCPKSQCNESLFGCCPDKKSFAKGNNNEGCPPPPPACLKSKFGCCSDNITAAEGPNDKGCEPEMSTTTVEPTEEYTTVANVSDCKTSPYRCCPDGSTAAEGPNYKGCKLECAKTTYGCCEDGHTPAHGYSREGCCLQTPFGCCPDNIKPAEGPNLEGCGCQYSPYKCCPNNITPARGYNNEGCGCQYSEHGCCADQSTQAAGPNYEGCPCHTYQFGCCPDGVTIATGPGKQGCGCRYSPNGCCSDEKTTAQGPNKEGCGCADTKYGCCYDGVTEAQGENFAGCTDVPANLQENCFLPRESGDCKDYTIKWYYDSEYGACSRFWYGGCGGNGNRFKDKAECDGTCVAPEGKDRCKLRKVEGPCTGYYPSWHYDKDRNHCAHFIWGGCLGNNNRFETSKECEDTCLKGSSGNVCQQPKEEGPCNGAYDRWYFDEKSGRCDRFRYGGCEGNGNNFRSDTECMQTCKEPGKLKDHCTLSKAEGNCTEKLARWYHDASEARCMPFYYTGCGSNNNNYQSIEECERDCPPKVELDMCHMPAETGDCANYVTKWYFDTKAKSCRQFYYGGCAGNKNNFNTEDECKQTCQLRPAPTTSPTPIVTRPQNTTTDVCNLPSEVGTCDNYTLKVYYNSTLRECEQFYYGGCNGNGNNFESIEDCQRACGKSPVQPTTQVPSSTVTETHVTTTPGGPVDRCELQYDVGNCYNYTLRWYYDYEHKYCRQFYYGSCSGNANNFVTKDECEEACHTQRPEPPRQETEICKLYLHRPPCEDTDKHWYYDDRYNECLEFTYEGCLNEGNRFTDKATCEKSCKTSSSGTPPVTEAPHDLTLCYQRVETGNCNESIPSYYFDPVEKKCSSFIYTGCDGNANRYNTEEQCERQCGKFREQDVCNLPKETGPCKENVAKIYYDASLQRCLQFAYGGCEGNANRFSSIEECEGICIKHEEKKPNETSTEICKLPLDVGVCTEYHKRWYFNDERGECTAFIYSGCGGNFNRFKSFNECYNTCKDYLPYSKPGTSYVPPDETEHPCQKYADECQQMYCPYGIESYVDEKTCTRCKCYNPCENYPCTSDSICAVNININKTKEEEPSFIAICRQINKPGECPELSDANEDCEDECKMDGDCPFDLKCCKSGCNNCVAVVPYAPPGELVTTANLPAYTEPPPKEGHSQPIVDEPNYKPVVRANEGDFVTLRCAVTGNPNPVITWRKNNLLIDGREARYRLLLDGALQIITLHKTDSGIYLCTADNKIGQPVQNKIELDVTDTDPYPATIVDDDERQKNLIVSLGSPTTLNCYAVGFPYPAVTWFKDHELIPLKTEAYEVRKDYSLLINSVKLPQLGIYTCQAYNGYGKAASWSVTVQALGPIYTTNSEDQQYLKYVVNQPQNPDEVKPNPLTNKPTTEPNIPQHNKPVDEVPNEVIEPQDTRVPVWANIPLANKRYRVGTNITIPCVVSGNPTPRVTWYKDDHPLYNSEKYKIAGATNYTLSIMNADRNDAGTYVCEARNYYQDYKDKVTIDIEGVTIPADCKDNPFFANCKLIVKGNYCSHVYYAKFCCRSCSEAGLLISPDVDVRHALDTNLVRRK